MLLSAVTYYMDVLRDTAILDLDRNNVEVLQEQLRQTQDRFNVGEVTRTDVAQAEASLAGARATALTAQSNLQASLANYRKAIGDEPEEPRAGRAGDQAAAEVLVRSGGDFAGRTSRDRGDAARRRRRGARRESQRRRSSIRRSG